MAATLAKHSGASRTSPILRGNWVSEFLLGEKLPRHPKNVPVLPEDAPADLTEHQLIERHSNDQHAQNAINASMALALQWNNSIPSVVFEPTMRTATKSTVNPFCRRLLGYALGRSVQLSDRPLMDQMLTKLEANDFCISIAVELIVLSPQFRMKRGR